MDLRRCYTSLYWWIMNVTHKGVPYQFKNEIPLYFVSCLRPGMRLLSRHMQLVVKQIFGLFVGCPRDLQSVVTTAVGWRRVVALVRASTFILGLSRRQVHWISVFVGFWFRLNRRHLHMVGQSLAINVTNKSTEDDLPCKCLVIEPFILSLFRISL